MRADVCPNECSRPSIDPTAASLAWAGLATMFPFSTTGLLFAAMALGVAFEAQVVAKPASTLIAVANASACARAGVLAPVATWAAVAVVLEVGVRSYPVASPAHRGFRFTAGVLDASVSALIATAL